MRSIHHELNNDDTDGDRVSQERIMQSLDVINDAFMTRRAELVVLAGPTLVDEVGLLLKWLSQRIEAETQLAV